MEYSYHETQIYLISGHARHGKDTIALFLKQNYEKEGKKVLFLACADYLKLYATKISNWDGQEDTKPRELLQQLGTLIRTTLNKKTMLIERTIDDILIYSYFYDVIIIKDIRLKQEIIDIKNKYPKAVTINVFRPNFNNGLSNAQQNHDTEKDLEDFDDFGYQVINETLEQLEKDIKNIYLQEKDK